VLVDGAIIADNPSMYAFLIASEMNTEKNIRVISIGNGKSAIEKLNPDNVSTFNWISKMQDLLVSVEVMTHAYFSEQMSAEYHRFNALVTSSDDSLSIEELKKLGYSIIANNTGHINSVIKSLCDDKFNTTETQE
jgi:hypothetical protein